MSAVAEVPDSQPSSPALSPAGNQEGKRDTEALQTTEDVQLGRNSQNPHVPQNSAPPRRKESEEHQQAKSPKLQGRAEPTDIEYSPPSKPATLSDDSPAVGRNRASPRPMADTKHPSRRPALKNTTTTRDPAYLRSRIAQLTTTIASTRSDLNATLSKLQTHQPAESDPLPATSSPRYTSTLQSSVPLNLDAERIQILHQAQCTLDAHVKMLSKYNAVKDVGMTMLGILAEQKGVTIRAIMEERGVSEDD